MLKFAFDPWRPYRVVVYLRMSSDKQNKRSPDQQLAEIKRRLQRLGYRWKIVKVYRDDAKSGRLFRGRPQFQQMLRELRLGTVEADLILVDTIERFGRLEELPTIRKELREKVGVLVLCADTDFADPTTPQGEAMALLENHRAKADAHVKAHNVLRGKLDTALGKHWPGGPRPFGFRLRSVTSERGGQVVVEGSVLEPEPEEARVIELAFRQAHAEGLGQNRLAHFLNAHPDVPEQFKPFLPSTVGSWLKNPLYKGVLVYGAYSSGIVDDTRVLQKNDEKGVLVVPDFCPPLVPPDVWEAVNRCRRARAEGRTLARRRRAGGGKLIAAAAPGLVVKYLLTGLVRCHHCGLAMTASSSPEYVTKAGESRRYTSYVCPNYLARLCPNGCRVPEEWLRQAVVGKVLELLSPRPAHEAAG